jgi:hypothetical protein
MCLGCRAATPARATAATSGSACATPAGLATATAVSADAGFTAHGYAANGCYRRATHSGFTAGQGACGKLHSST